MPSKHKRFPQKNPRVRKIRVRNSGVGNGCANFMDTWKKCVLSAGKTMSVKFPFFGGGGVFWGFGGGSADFIFMGARIFLIVGPFHPLEVWLRKSHFLFDVACSK